MTNRQRNQFVASELQKVGIVAREKPGATGFLKKVRIVNGEVHYQPDAAAADIIHEAGHLACIPPAYRPLANDDLASLFKEMCEAVDQRAEESGDLEDPLIRAILQCSDHEATAWAYAFGKKIGLPDEVVIQDEDYDGEGAGIRLGLSLGHYAGINGLRAAGLIETVRDYPNLLKWTQDAR